MAKEQGVGLVVNNFREITTAVETLLEPANFARYRAAAAAVNNQAVFEIPQHRKHILSS